MLDAHLQGFKLSRPQALVRVEVPTLETVILLK